MSRHQYITELLEKINQQEKTIQQQTHRLTTQEQTINTLTNEINHAHNTTQQLITHTQNLINHIIKTKPPTPTQTLHTLQLAIQETETLPLYEQP